jgi:prephenate dehydrogenase
VSGGAARARAASREAGAHAAAVAELPHAVAIIGLGLIGGSLARDLARRGVHVFGHDTCVEHATAAVASGSVHTRLDDDLAGIEDAAVVVLAVPVDAAPAVLQRIAPRLGRATLITDVGSTKTAIVRTARELDLGGRFVGSHPLAGDHRSGWLACRDGLFEGARVYLTPSRQGAASDASGVSAAADAPLASAALRAAERLWQAVGATTEVIDAGVHDRRVAWTSHLPQAVATLLACTLQDAGIAQEELGRGGRDVTRLAASDAAIWTAITMDNGAHIGTALASLEQCMAAFRVALESGDERAVRAAYAAAAAWSVDG